MGVVDSEYIVHKGIQTLGGGSTPAKKVSCFICSAVIEIAKHVHVDSLVSGL